MPVEYFCQKSLDAVSQRILLRLILPPSDHRGVAPRISDSPALGPCHHQGLPCRLMWFPIAALPNSPSTTLGMVTCKAIQSELHKSLPLSERPSASRWSMQQRCSFWKGARSLSAHSWCMECPLTFSISKECRPLRANQYPWGLNTHRSS